MTNSNKALVATLLILQVVICGLSIIAMFLAASLDYDLYESSPGLYAFFISLPGLYALLLLVFIGLGDCIMSTPKKAALISAIISISTITLTYSIMFSNSMAVHPGIIGIFALILLGSLFLVLSPLVWRTVLWSAWLVALFQVIFGSLDLYAIFVV